MGIIALPYSWILVGAHWVGVVLTLFFILNGVILSYHWYKYGTSPTATLTALLLYAGGGIIFLGYYGTAFSTL